MKHRVIAALAVVVCLWVGCNSAFADDLVWQTSKETAVSMALSQGKKILLLGGSETCSLTQYMKRKACESVSPPIKNLIERFFIPWYGDRDQAVDQRLYNTDWFDYAKGVGAFSFPLICVIDPNDSKTFLDRTAGPQDLQVFYSRLLRYASPLYFPHVDTSLPWQTEIAIINTSDQKVTGTLRGLRDDGQLVETKNVTLSAYGRRQIIIADEFTNHINIGYIIYEADSDTVQGYTKLYQEGKYRAAIPAVKAKELSTSDIYIAHIASNDQWRTEISLLNTTSATKELTITFNTGQIVPITLQASEYKVFAIPSLFNGQPQPNIQSAVITNARGIIGMEFFANSASGNQMEGILLTDNTASTIYYPHIANDGWWTGVVAYNPAYWASRITITPYSAQGTALLPKTLLIPGEGKYVGTVAQLGLPAQTAWFKIDSTSPITGFELFGTIDGNQLAAYAEMSGNGARKGVFAKVEKNGGWTGIAFVNTEATAASVILTAYKDNGTPVATRALPVDGYAKVLDHAENIFSPQDITSATYISYSSDRNVVGFQLNSTSDGMMLDGLPTLAGTN